MNFKKDYPELSKFIKGGNAKFEQMRTALTVRFLAEGHDPYVTDADVISMIKLHKMRVEGASEEEMHAFNEKEHERYLEEIR